MGRAEQQLAQFPNAGVVGIRPGTRRLIVGDYILSYRRRDAGVEIFAVRHASRRNARL
jgi:plasmid stabilization system protein ParE